MRSFFIAVGVATIPVFGDRLFMAGDARFTGTVLSIREDGRVELASVISPNALWLKGDQIKKVEFSMTEPYRVQTHAFIELINGDVLPVDIERLHGENLEVLNPDMGPLRISRKMLKLMQLGVHQQPILYGGPAGPSDWTAGRDPAKSWQFINDAFISSGQALARKGFDLPDRFILKFNIRWQESPNFKIYFADPLALEESQVDRYYLQFTSSGVGVQREYSQGKKEQTVISPSRGAEEFPNHQMNVEVRVDRKSSRIHLLLNGELEGTGVDPIGHPPQGNGLTLVSDSPGGFSQEIRSIELTQYDNSDARHLAEERSDSKTDCLINREEEQWSGTLTEIRKGNEGNLFFLKSDFQDPPLEIPQMEVSTVFFAEGEKRPTPELETVFSLKLRGGGVLKVNSCVFSENIVTVQHPLLGELKFDRAGVASMDRNAEKQSN